MLAGIVRGRSRVALIGALRGWPFLLYLFASPRIGLLAVVVGLLYVGSSQAVASRRRVLAVAMAAPFVLLVGFVAKLVGRRTSRHSSADASIHATVPGRLRAALVGYWAEEGGVDRRMTTGRFSGR